MALWQFKNTQMETKYPELWNASCVLAGYCDGAITQDGVGYNGLDSSFMRDVLAKEYCTPRMAIAIHKMLLKYRVQLLHYNINYDSIPKPENVVQSKPVKTLNVIARDGKIFLQNGFDDKLNMIYRECRGTIWHGDIKMRQVGNSIESMASAADVLERANKELGYTICGDDDSIKKLHSAKKKLADRDAKKTVIAGAATDFTVDLTKELRKAGLKVDEFDIRPYQMAGIKIIDMAKGKCIIGDEMGLGKTVQAIAWAIWRKKKALVICPAGLKFNWQNEVRKFSNASADVVNGKYDGSSQFTIINYELLSKYMEDIENSKFDLVIIDESHYIKNNKAQRTKNALRIAKKIKHVLLITGTAIKSRPVEFFNQLNLVNSNEFHSFWWYAQTYCGAFHNGFGWNFSGASNIDQLINKIRDIYYRRNKCDVLTELPPKIRQTIWINDITARMLEAKVSSGKTIDILAAITKSRVALSHHKTNIIIEWIENFLEEQDSNKKLIVFSNFLEVTKAIMDKFGNTAVHLIGEDDAKQRQASVDAFQNDDSVRIFTGTIGAAGVGITLTAADTVLFVDLPWTPGELVQAEDRAHRIGQTSSVTIYQILFANTIEQDIYELIQAKMEVVNQVLSGKDVAADSRSIQAELIERIKIRMRE